MWTQAVRLQGACPSLCHSAWTSPEVSDSASQAPSVTKDPSKHGRWTASFPELLSLSTHLVPPLPQENPSHRASPPCLLTVTPPPLLSLRRPSSCRAEALSSVPARSEHEASRAVRAWTQSPVRQAPCDHLSTASCSPGSSASNLAGAPTACRTQTTRLLFASAEPSDPTSP